MNNKEVIDKLQEYFLTQDPVVVARLAAGLMIDINRFYNPISCSDDELQNLWKRTESNVQQLKSFIENGPNGSLTIGVQNSDN